MFAKDPALATRMQAMLRRLIETVGLRSEAAKARLAELEDLLDQSTEDPLIPRAADFTKLRPLPLHSGAGSKL